MGLRTHNSAGALVLGALVPWCLAPSLIRVDVAGLEHLFPPVDFTNDGGLHRFRGAATGKPPNEAQIAIRKGEKRDRNIDIACQELCRAA